MSGHLTALSVLISSILALFRVEIPRKRNSYVLGINMKNAVASMFLALMFALTASCGGSSSDSEGTATPEIVLNLPAEFSTGETGRAVPDYVTGIFLTVTGDGMEDIELSIDPDNLSASVTVTFGTRTFSIVITTSIGKTFTGWKTVEVTSGSTRIIEIDLVVNDPPKVTLKASNGAPVIGQAVALTATATDADGDPMTYSWSKSGGALSASGLSGKWHSPDSGSYKVTFTASDGRGGVGTATVGIAVQASVTNAPPVIGSFASTPALPAIRTAVDMTMQIPAGTITYDTVVLDCAATDADGDPLTYSISGTELPTPVAGPTAGFTISMAGPHSYTCQVSDGVNPPVTKTWAFSAPMISNHILTAGGGSWSGPWTLIAATGLGSYTVSCIGDPVIQVAIDFLYFPACVPTASAVAPAVNTPLTFTYSPPALPFTLNTRQESLTWPAVAPGGPISCTTTSDVNFGPVPPLPNWSQLGCA